ncbi:MAG: Segregation and condensation protein B [Candidatus Omnitrophica bacterium]|nr:Segregation and condensation protein B [Candidatus Omnitrophota bacterium]
MEVGLERDEIKRAIEALLFATDKPLSPEEIRQAFEDNETDPAQVRTILGELEADYLAQGRGFRMAQLAGGYQLVSDPRYAEQVKRFYQSRERKRVSQAGLETLAIIAYKQPVTKAEIEFIRGVNVDRPLKTLLEKGFIRLAGRKEVPGRPILYGTTKEFLEHFGINSVKELPPLSEFTERDIDPALLPPEMQRQDGALAPDTSADGAPAPAEDAAAAQEEARDA